MTDNYTIMILDDNAMMQKFLGNYFKDSYKVVAFQHVLNAWKWLNEGNHVDLILADIKMPDISGIQFLEQLKCSGLHKDIPVMMLSGVEKSDDRIKCLRLGAVDFVMKPFNPKELEVRVEQHLLLKGNSINTVY
ncbi:MAG: response regulator [Bacteroidota bacterium]